MDAIRVAKVEHVLCSKGGATQSGTLHLTTHHLIFGYENSEEEEIFRTRSYRCRTFEIITLSFRAEQEAIDVFESIKELTVATSITQLYAFFYTPNPPFTSKNGWSIYSPREEFGRMGVGSRSKAWRFTDINKDYSFCSTYPAKLVVPTRISDTTIQYASKYRSKCRIPVLTYLHWANFGSITRSSQPMVGLTNSRSIQDEKLIEAIFQTHHSPESRAVVSRIYGATATNLIIDARPTTNAVANTAKGAGTENMDHYKDARKAYLGIDNIHTMRDSLTKVVEALREAEMAAASAAGSVPGETPPVPVLDRQALRRSGWLRHLSAIVEGSLLIVRNVHINSSHVLIHCSDGWDRTAQLSSISQLCLDPFYRTIRGFQILVEKDWLSFGHKFLDRCGHLSSEKFFLAPVDISNNPSGAEAAQAFFASVQNRFASQTHLKETSPVFHQFLESVRQIQRQFPERFEFNERFLRRLYYHLYSCQFGTFLCNSERERRVGEGGQPPCDVTVSVWDFFNSPPEDNLNLNPDYDPSLDDPANRTGKTDMGVLLPNPKDIRFWHELYGRTDEEMNGKFVARQVAQSPELVAPVGPSEDDTASLNIQTSTPSAPHFISLPPSPSRSPAPSLAPVSSPSSLARVAIERAGSPLQTTAMARSASASGSIKGRTRHDSLKGFDAGTVGSAYTLKTQSGSTIPPRSPSPLNRSSTLRPPSSPRITAAPSSSDLFGAGGVRSMWGKLSSNATAAFSAVQDVYGGVTKDFKGLSLASGSQSERGGELKGKDEIATWSDERSASPFSQAAYSSETVSNPWSTTAARPNVPSMYLDNPWSTARSPSPASHPSLGDISFDKTTGELPKDPSVALPVSRDPVPRSRETTPSTSSSLIDSSLAGSLSSSPSASSDVQKSEAQSTPTSTTALQSQPPPPATPFDPLGVGTF